MSDDPAQTRAVPQSNPDGKASALDVTKVVAAVAVVSYLVGVLTVSIYLHHLDLAAPDLTTFKARYMGDRDRRQQGRAHEVGREHHASRLARRSTHAPA